MHFLEQNQGHFILSICSQVTAHLTLQSAEAQLKKPHIY